MFSLKFGVVLLIAGALSAPASAELVAYTGVIGGANTLCSGDGGPDPATSFFHIVGFGILNPPPGGTNGIGDCGLSGGINEVSGLVGPQSSSTILVKTPYSTNPTSSVSGSASATANYGTVGIATSATVNGVTGYDGFAQSAAFATASDMLSVTCVPACTTGSISFDFGLNATLTVGSPFNAGGAGAQMEVDVQAGGDANQSIFYGNIQGASVYAAGIEPVLGYGLLPGQAVPGCVSGSGTFTCTNATLQTDPMLVSFAGPIPFEFGLIANTNPDINQTVSADPPGLSLTGIQVYDANGNPITDFTITSGSGAGYGADGIESEPASASVPEPSSVVLLLTMLLGVACLARKRLAEHPAASAQPQ